MSGDLKPLGPEQAVEMYLERQPSTDSDISEKSLQNLDTFIEFCGESDIQNLNALTGQDLHRYRTSRSRDDLSKATLKTHLSTLREFLEYCASIRAIEKGLQEKVVFLAQEEATGVKLSEERAKAILHHLDRSKYASSEHAIFAILWHTGIRLGTLRTLDVDDWDPNAGALRIRHRPETGTPLGNGKAAERQIAVSDYYAGVLGDYLADNRESVETPYGRNPLITSANGRLSEPAIREAVYYCTFPCMIGGCPHGREVGNCAAMRPGHASLCPSSRSSYGIRRGAFTRMLHNGVPEGIVRDRLDMSNDEPNQHYDCCSERERMETRREFLEADR